MASSISAWCRVQGIKGMIMEGESLPALYLVDLPAPYYRLIMMELKRNDYVCEPGGLIFSKQRRKRGTHNR